MWLTTPRKNIRCRPHQRRPPRLGTSSQPAHPTSGHAAMPNEPSPRPGGSRSGSDTGTSGSGSAESGHNSVVRGAAGRANIPMEKTRLSQIAEARRSQDSPRVAGPSRISHEEPPGAKSQKISFPGTPQMGKQATPRPTPSRAASQQSPQAVVSDNAAQECRVSSSTNTDGPVSITQYMPLVQFFRTFYASIDINYGALPAVYYYYYLI